MFIRLGMGGGSINIDMTSYDNVQLRLCVYPQVLHFLRALFPTKPLIPKTCKGMKAKEMLLMRMLNDMEWGKVVWILHRANCNRTIKYG